MFSGYKAQYRIEMKTVGRREVTPEGEKKCRNRIDNDQKKNFCVCVSHIHIHPHPISLGVERNI